MVVVVVVVVAQLLHQALHQSASTVPVSSSWPLSAWRLLHHDDAFIFMHAQPEAPPPFFIPLSSCLGVAGARALRLSSPQCKEGKKGATLSQDFLLWPFADSPPPLLPSLHPSLGFLGGGWDFFFFFTNHCRRGGHAKALPFVRQSLPSHKAAKCRACGEGGRVIGKNDYLLSIHVTRVMLFTVFTAVSGAQFVSNDGY